MNSEKTVKHQRVVKYLQEHRLGAVLLSRRCNFSWYTCGAHNYVGNACEVGNSHLLVHKDGAMLLANNIEAARLAGEELTDGSVEIIEYPWCEPSERDKAFKKAIAALKIAVDAEVPGVNAPLLGGDFDCLRWSLTAEEIDRYRKLCTDTVGAVESTAESAKRGMSEWALAGRLHSALMERCCLPWVTLVAGDERVASYRHPLPTGKKINRYFMLVTCAERDGLLAACTRLASFGPLTSELVIKHRAVTGVDAAMISSTRRARRWASCLKWPRPPTPPRVSPTNGSSTIRAARADISREM